jgi:hypothetical protein
VDEAGGADALFDGLFGGGGGGEGAGVEEVGNGDRCLAGPCEGR